METEYLLERLMDLSRVRRGTAGARAHLPGPLPFTLRVRQPSLAGAAPTRRRCSGGVQPLVLEIEPCTFNIKVGPPLAILRAQLRYRRYYVIFDIDA